MKILLYYWLLISPFAAMKKPEIAPKAPYTGMNTITWIGFDKQVVTSPVPMGVTNITMPSPLYPKKVANQNLFYQEIVLVDPKFKPGNPVTKPPLKGNWFIRRRVLRVQNGKEDVLQTTRLFVNKNAEATDPADQTIPSTATHVEYRLGQTVKIIGRPKPGEKVPKVTTSEVFPYDAVRVAIQMSAIIANTCQVKMQVTRPIPCEFQTVKFQILGKSGKILYETASADGAAFKIPDTEAKKTEGPNLFYDAKWTVKRIHKPNYAVIKGYEVNWGQSGNDFNAEVDSHGSLVTGLKLDETIGKEFTIPVEIKAASGSSGFSLKMRELLLENDITKTKFPTTQMPGSARADGYIRLNW